ncbi:MAG: flagellar biosynthetic protein FliO [candidate division Zixibacteria bacterium]|nr:flagellar biosynthetic protein FliO [candidate division Zixibacteria bacterium]
MKLITVLSVVLMLPGLVMAQDTTQVIPKPPQIDYNPGIAGILLKLFISLIIVVGLIYLSIFLLKKINNKTYASSNQLISIIGKSYLAPKQSLYIVKMGLSYAVLGVCENSINLIKELAPKEVESLQKYPEKNKGFQNIFKSVLNK